jgi:hypothetical protein
MTLPKGGSDFGLRSEASQPAVSIEIPFTSHGGDAEVIEIVYDELSDDNISDVLQVLREEKARLHYWVTIALECYRRGQFIAFERILETARVEANISYDNVEEDQVCHNNSMQWRQSQCYIYNSIADECVRSSCCVQCATCNKGEEERTET